MLEDKDVDAVVIAAPDHRHALAAILASAARMDVYADDRGATLRNSSGFESSDVISVKFAHWVDYSAVIKGTQAGVAAFDHPSNLRHPTGWHARGHGLCAANSFAAKGFSKGEASDGSYALPAGQELRLRYRALIHERAFGPAENEKLFQEWARPCTPSRKP